MASEVKVRAVVCPVDLAPAKRKQILDVACLLRVMRKLLVIVKAQSFLGQSQIRKERFSVVLKILVQGTVLPLFTKGLILHLFELDRAECKVLGRDLVAECLSDLPDAKRQFCTHGAQDVQVVDILALRVFRSQIDCTRAVIRRAALRLKH